MDLGMLGRESPQRSRFGAHLSVEHLLTLDSFYEVLYRESDRLLADEDFAACYDLTTGGASTLLARFAASSIRSMATMKRPSPSASY
jgi:hypothetical protein